MFTLRRCVCFEDMKCQGVNAKLYGKLCRCIPRDSKYACSYAVLQLWIREVVWALTGVLRILTHLLSFSVMFSFCLFFFLPLCHLPLLFRNTLGLVLSAT
jgi:hypothetical protein